MKNDHAAELNNPIKTLAASPLFFVYVIMVALFIIAQIISPGFLSLNHVNSILIQASFLGLVSIGQTMVMLLGGIDLSVAYVITLTNLVGAEIMDGNNGNVLKAFIVCLLIGLAAGLINGICIYALKVPAMIMTLATGTVLDGIGLIYSKGAPKGNSASLVEYISTGHIFNSIPCIVLIWAIASAAVIIALRKSVFGRSIYAIGSNCQAAEYSGINTSKIGILVYTISGMISGIVGVLYVGYTNTSYLSAGDTFMMGTVAAVVVGSTSPAGGEGSYTGTVAGAIIMTVLTAVLTVVHIEEAGRKIIEGIIIILLVYIYSRRKAKS